VGRRAADSSPGPLRRCSRLSAPSDLYVISPFHMPSLQLQQLSLRTPGVVFGRASRQRETWVETRIGTVHTFRGKGRADHPDARSGKGCQARLALLGR
jgi:hypothetical protein